MTLTTRHLRPTVTATLFLVLGVVLSLAMNVKAVSLSDVPDKWAYVSAVVWPVLLFGAIELLVHTPWVSQWQDDLTRLGVLGVVGGFAAYVSYFHGAHVLSYYGYDTVSRYLGPVAIDATMALATLALNRVVQARRGAVQDKIIPSATAPAGPTSYWVSTAGWPTLPIVSMAPSEEWLALMSDVARIKDVPVEQELAVRETAHAARTVAWDETEAKALVAAVLDSRAMRMTDVDILLGHYYGRSARTMARFRARLGLVPVSAIPA